MTKFCRLAPVAAMMAVFLFPAKAAVVGGPGGVGGWDPSQILGQGIVVHPTTPGNTLEVRSMANGIGILWDFPDGIGGNPSARINANPNDFSLAGGVLSLNTGRTEQVAAFTNINFMSFFQQTTPVTPNPGTVSIYIKSDGNLYKIGSDGVEVNISGGGGGGGGSVLDAGYGPSWDGQIATAPSMNSVFDQVETMVSDVAFGPSWAGSTRTAPSRNALFDKLNSMGGGSGDVTAANVFTNDNRMIKSDGAAKGVQATGITVDDSNNISGVGTITTATGGVPIVPSSFGTDNRVLRSDGTVNNIQASVVTLGDNGAFTFPTGIRQGFSPDTTNPGLNVGLVNSAQPTSALNGDMWFYSGGSAMRAMAGNVAFSINVQDSVVIPVRSLKPPVAVASAALMTDEDTDRWLFNDSTDQFVQWQTMMPKSFSGVNWALTLTWSAATATTGNVIWGVQVMACNSTIEDANAAGYAAANITSSQPTGSTLGSTVQTPINISNGDSATQPSVLVKLRIFRDADNASDTMTGDAELLGVQMQWTRGNN